MTKQAQAELEKRFNQLKGSCTTVQWSDASFLFARVEELERNDIALTFRLMQRVKNLNPSEANQAKLAELRKQAFQEIPELTTLSSIELNTKDKFLDSANNVKEQFVIGLKHPRIEKFKRPFVIFVLLPFLLFTFYQVFIASPRFESQAKLIVKEPDGMATLDPTMAIMSGFGVGTTSLDTEIVKAFIYSNDMLMFLEDTLKISEHYSDNKNDFFSRLENDASRERFLKYYLSKVLVEVDEKSQVIHIFVQAFDADFSHLVSFTIVERAEWFINEIGHNLAKEQLKFVKLEHQLAETRLQKAKTELLAFQRRHNLLDPEAEGVAFQQITYQLEGEVASKRTELNALRSSMSDNAPMVIQAKSQLNSLLEQLEQERARLTTEKPSNNSLPEEERNLSVSQVVSKFSDFKINMELALQAYTSSQVSLEKSRVEAYRQLKYLVTVESPTQPEEAKYPEVFYNISLFLAVTLMLFGIVRIIIATVEELR
ncbi:MAG: lipopolysaccharide biosynthesis protein [Paraglaciecola sp.]|uniref:lipopolysaccharide biosynthesis protein n=1 Tax=Paraglaciecola sp. TaxID=1920173 RepID=UPI003296C30B